MTGMELARKYYEAFGKPMLEESFPQLLPYLAVGLFGEGSECLGYDDGISEDHDFGPGFCILLPGEDVVDRRAEFALERAYLKLPATFEGYSRPAVSPVGGERKGVKRTADFFRTHTGTPDGNLSPEQWLRVPEQSLLQAVNGEIFSDPYGECTAIRQRLRKMPEDVRRKRLSAHLLNMAQSGQYNYQRCLDHGEEGAAQLAAVSFVRSTLSAVFLLNRQYEPYYKWVFRAMRDLPVLSQLSQGLIYLLTSPNDPETSFEKYTVIEETAESVISVLIEEGLSQAVCTDLEKHTYSVNDSIQDSEIRNRHILSCLN